MFQTLVKVSEETPASEPVGWFQQSLVWGGKIIGKLKNSYARASEKLTLKEGERALNETITAIENTTIAGTELFNMMELLAITATVATAFAGVYEMFKVKKAIRKRARLLGEEEESPVPGVDFFFISSKQKTKRSSHTKAKKSAKKKSPKKSSKKSPKQVKKSLTNKSSKKTLKRK